MTTLVLGIIGIVLGWAVIRSQKIPPDAIEVEGTVVDVSSRVSSSGPGRRRMYKLKINYRDPLNGEETVFDRPGTTSAPHEIGDRVQMIYDVHKRQPIYRSQSQRQADWLLLIIGVIFVGLGIYQLAG